jgi:hypothetical protein
MADEATSAKPSASFTVFLPYFFSACSVAALQNRRGVTTRGSQKWRGVRQSPVKFIRFLIGSSSTGLTEEIRVA